MDRSDELPDLVNGMSLDTSKDSTDVSGRIDILLRDVSGLFSSIYGECAPSSRPDIDH